MIVCNMIANFAYDIIPKYYENNLNIYSFNNIYSIQCDPYLFGKFKSGIYFTWINKNENKGSHVDDNSIYALCQENIMVIQNN